MEGIIRTNVPKDCSRCPFCEAEGDWLGMLYKAVCKVSGERVEVYYGETIPKSCPIKPMPKLKIPNGSDIFNDYVRGWNDCLKEIDDDKS